MRLQIKGEVVGLGKSGKTLKYSLKLIKKKEEKQQWKVEKKRIRDH